MQEAVGGPARQNEQQDMLSDLNCLFGTTLSHVQQDETHLVTMLFESSVAPPRANVIQVGSPLNNELYSVACSQKKQYK